MLQFSDLGLDFEDLTCFRGGTQGIGFDHRVVGRRLALGFLLSLDLGHYIF